MFFGKFLNYIFVTCLIVFSSFFSSCGIDERSKREKEEERKQTMDSAFKDADQVPVMEMEEEADTIR